MVLTHLILNDMIKVKGQVCHVVLRLLDAAETVSDLAKLFFNELSKRSNNPIFNLMGDIVAILSRDETEVANDGISVRLVTPAEFQTVMSFLLAFVKTERYSTYFPFDNSI